MKKKIACSLIACAVLILSARAAQAQSLRFKFERIFDEVLRLQLAGSPGEHGQHFNPDNVASSDKAVKSLTHFVGKNIASFPLSSTGATFVFDLSTGVTVRSLGSLGPIFSETATTLGRGHVILGYNFTYLKLSNLRGLNLDDLRFTFSHQDVNNPGLGDSDNELDTIDLFMDMELEASVLAFYFTAGLTDRIDLGFALPLVNVRVKADPFARVNSFTLLANDTANHFYGGTQTDPVLTTRPTPISDDATGLGDIALRAKLKLLKLWGADVSGLAEARLPTGDEDNFLGSGHTAVRAALVASGEAWEGVIPHLNLAYVYRDSELDHDNIELFVGYEQNVRLRFTFVVDVLARFEVGSRIEQLRFDEKVTIRRPAGNTEFVQDVELTNMPQLDRDHTFDLSVGGKYAPKEFLVVVGNVFFPLNDDGMRSDFVTTLGFEFNF